MLEQFAPWIVQGGAVGVLFWVGALIFTGRLVPRSTIERDIRAPLQQLAAERGAAYEAERARADLLAVQLGQFAQVARRTEVGP